MDLNKCDICNNKIKMVREHRANGKVNDYYICSKCGCRRNWIHDLEENKRYK